MKNKSFTTVGSNSGGVKKSDTWRVPRTISFTPEQDRYFTEMLGERGNVSEFIRRLVDSVREGLVALPDMPNSDRPETNRALAYHRAKEAGMAFEEDVGVVLSSLKKWRVVKNRIHHGNGGVFVADFSIEDGTGEVRVSVQCKSSPRPDRLSLALAEAMIGTQKTGAPVITVVPYLLPESDPAMVNFEKLGFKLVELSGLLGAVAKFV